MICDKTFVTLMRRIAQNAWRQTQNLNNPAFVISVLAIVIIIAAKSSFLPAISIDPKAFWEASWAAQSSTPDVDVDTAPTTVPAFDGDTASELVTGREI